MFSAFSQPFPNSPSQLPKLVDVQLSPQTGPVPVHDACELVPLGGAGQGLHEVVELQP